MEFSSRDSVSLAGIAWTIYLIFGQRHSNATVVEFVPRWDGASGRVEMTGRQ